MDGKRVLITGAGRGIGRDLSLGFARAGATVVVSARSTAELNALESEIAETGGRAKVYPCDVTDVSAVEAMRDTIVEELGGLDILINNAGIADSHKFVTHPDELWHRIIAVNLTGVYSVTKAFAPGMLEHGWGRIINMASVASKVGGKYIAAYTASKHGVLGLTRALAVELGPQVTVNAICPGYVDTPMTDGGVATMVERTGMTEDEVVAILTKHTVQKRLIEPEELTALALYLASEAAAGVTGQSIVVDGGGIMA